MLPWDRKPPVLKSAVPLGRGKKKPTLINVMSCICSLGLGRFQPASSPLACLPHPRTFPLLVYLEIHTLRNQRGDDAPRLGSETMTAVLRASRLGEHPGSRLGRGQRPEQGRGAGRLRNPLEKRNNNPGSPPQEAGEGIPTWPRPWAGRVWSSIAGY